MKNKGKYHTIPHGGGQITVPKGLADIIDFENKDKVMMEYDEDTEVLTVKKL